MKETAYVLMQDFILGVFDSPKIPQKQLEEYFAGAYETIRFHDVRDSGIEWELEIKTKHDGFQKLTMMYFGVNEI